MKQVKQQLIKIRKMAIDFHDATRKAFISCLNDCETFLLTVLLNKMQRLDSEWKE